MFFLLSRSVKNINKSKKEICFIIYSWNKNSYFPLRSLVTVCISSLLSFVHFYPCEVASDAYPHGAHEFTQGSYLGCSKILAWYNGFATIIAVFVIFFFYLLVFWKWWFQGGIQCLEQNSTSIMWKPCFDFAFPYCRTLTGLSGLPFVFCSISFMSYLSLYVFTP